MFRGNRKYYFILAMGLAIMIVLEIIAPKPISWQATFAKKDKMPYGSFVLHQMLPTIFPNTKIDEEANPVYNAMRSNTNLKGNYLFFNERFKPDELDTESLLEFVGTGNNVFVAANHFEGKFADTLSLKIDYDKSMFFQLYQHDSLAYDTVILKLVNKKMPTPSQYNFKRIVDNFFAAVDTPNTIVLGVNENDKPNFIKVKHGAGHFFLHTAPRAFSNYYLTDSLTAEYTFKALSYLPVAPVIWDEHYKIGRSMVRTPIRFILQNPPLKTAYWLLLISAFVFAVLGLKREQRMIPVVEPYKNTTLEFVDTIGTLDHQKGQHRNTAIKKINYFLAQIRSRFNLETNRIDTDFYNKLELLSGVTRREIVWMFDVFDKLKNKLEVTDSDILKLNKLIEEFNSKSKR